MRRVAIVLLLLLSAAACFAQTPESHKLRFPTLQVASVQAEQGIVLPAEFRVALYENTIREVQKTGRFERVYRDGETPADPAKTAVLRMTVTGFKEGSARMRQVTTVAGATKIKVQVQFYDQQGTLLLDREVDGNVYFLGENLRATYNFSKSVARVVKDAFHKRPAA